MADTPPAETTPAEATPERGPRLASDSMSLRVPGLATLVRGLARRLRETLGEEATVHPRDLQADEDFDAFIHEFALGGYSVYGSRKVASDQADLLGAHILYLTNYELHRRKTFWVSAPLAFELQRTRLDVDGEVLRPPFQACAFAFTDPASLALGEGLLQVDDPGWLREVGRPKVITFYVTESASSGDDAQTVEGRGLDVDVLLDPLDPINWPYLYSRSLLVRPRDRLEAILDSQIPEVDPAKRGAVFSSPELKALLSLAINAILYATSAGVEIARIPSPLPELERAVGRKKSRQKRAQAERAIARFRNEATGDDVFYLPGKIPITQMERLSSLEGSEGGSQLMTRFMVRGHWRAANPSWKDQRPRWIRPYWKGPDLATVIERAYELK